jgi:DNA uptake protein ComE-like DNA-binding protein
MIHKFLAHQALKGLDHLESRLNPLRLRLQQDPYYRFQSFEEVQLAVQLGIRIDVNQATADDWLRLPGLSIHQARSLAQLTGSGVALTGLADLAAALGLSEQRLQPLAPILQFCYYDPESAIQPITIHVNQASLEHLTRVPAIDLYLARRIVQQRPFRNLVDLQQRLQLSPPLTTALLHHLRF